MEEGERNDKRNDKKSSDCLRRALNRIKGGMYMKMRTRIISLSILAILTVCLLNVAAASATTPTAAPHSKIVTVVNTDSKVKLVGTTLSIHASPSRNVNSGGTVYFSGYLTETNGQGNRRPAWNSHGQRTTNVEFPDRFRWLLGSTGDYILRGRYVDMSRLTAMDCRPYWRYKYPETSIVTAPAVANGTGLMGV